MEEFLKNAVIDCMEGEGLTLTENEIQTAVDRLIEDDEIWNTLTTHIYYILREIKYETKYNIKGGE